MSERPRPTSDHIRELCDTYQHLAEAHRLIESALYTIEAVEGADETIRRIAREEAQRLLEQNLAAALADPDVHPHAKSLAGNLLRRLNPAVAETGTSQEYGAEG